MDKNQYQEIMANTMIKNYAEYICTDMFKELQNRGEIKYDGKIEVQDDPIDLSRYDSNEEKVEALFEKLSTAVKFCEEFEYNRAYRYSSICKYQNINFEKLGTLKTQNKVSEIIENSEFDDKLKRSIGYPTVKIDGNKVYLKFSIKLHSKIEGDSDLKHVVLAVINKDTKTIEIRQHTVPIAYNNQERIYEKNIYNVKSWLKLHLDAYIIELDLQAITRYMKANKEPEVKITAVSLRRHGMEADLDSASNSELTLPILDELRNKIAQEEIFHNNPTGIEIKEMLEGFMVDIEDNSDLPAAKIFWPQKDIKIHMFHGEVSSATAILKFMGKLKDKESMDYVAEYIINSETELSRSFED